MSNSSPIIHHSSLVTLGRRVRARWLLGRIRIGLVWALAADAVIVLAGRLLGYGGWSLIALLLGVLIPAVAVVISINRWPDRLTVARAADALGLEERVTSALYAAQASHPAADLLTLDAVKALARVNPSDYPLLPGGHLRRLEMVAAAGLITALLLPFPAIGDGGRRAAESQSVVTARRSVQSLEKKLSATPEPLVQAAAAELKTSEERLAEARSAEEAARILEQTQDRLAGQAKPEDYAWQRALEGVSSAWRDNPDLSTLAGAIQAGDQKAMQQAVADLTGKADTMSPEEKQALALALQAGANAARDAPDLAGALRQAAAQAGRSTSNAQGETGAEGTLGNVASQLSQGMASSTGLQSVQQAVAGVGQARAGLGTVAGSTGATGALASGPVSGSASGGQAGSEGGPQTGSGSGSGGDTSSGSGAGSGSGSGSGGPGGAGGGAGAGAGAGGGASSGQPGSGSVGATTSGGNVAPSLRGATNYDPVYVPTLIGGSGGPRVQAPGEANGAGGQTVETPSSPLELGAVRPYNEVYGQYEASARQSLSRQSLPPSLQDVVQRYFSSIAPESK